MALTIQRINRLSHPRHKRYGWLLYGITLKEPNGKRDYFHKLIRCDDDKDIKNVGKGLRGMKWELIKNFEDSKENADEQEINLFEQWVLSKKLKRKLKINNQVQGDGAW